MSIREGGNGPAHGGHLGDSGSGGGGGGSQEFGSGAGWCNLFQIAPAARPTPAPIPAATAAQISGLRMQNIAGVQASWPLGSAKELYFNNMVT